MCFNFTDFIILVILFLSYLLKVFVMDCADAGPSGLRFITRNELYAIMQSSNKTTFEEKLQYMELQIINQYADDHPMLADVKQKLSVVKHHFKQKWLAARKTKTRFEENYSSWLSDTICLPITGNIGPGRPTKCFTDLSERSKRRKTEELRSKNVDELTYATQMKLRDGGKVAASKIIRDLTKSPRRATKYVRAIKKSMDGEDQPPRQLSPLQALAMFTEAGLTKARYEIIRDTNKTFFPCYSILQKVKKECYPEVYRVTETCAEVQVQELMNHTTKRLLLHLGETVNTLSNEEKQSLVLISKWGCDGSHQIQYKMKFENEADTDANVFQSSVVPLQLVYGPEQKILWQNSRPSSLRYCRPIRIRFVKETTDITNEEINYIKEQIKSMSNTDIDDLIIKHKMIFTMVDGKVCNAATQTKSTMRCYICDATSADFNDLAKKRPSKKENLSFGLSLLHARIRFFESILHLAYKIPIRKWHTRLTTEEKEIVQNRKHEIQNAFKNQLGLLVDIPKANYGNTNDGNTSRRFFEEFEISAAITGVDQSLIYRFKVILDTLCCGLKINIQEFEKYCRETAELYVELYSFYPMSPTLHKVLLHGAEVIRNAILPIGQLSEEAAEARNKHIRSYRLNYTRKFSRVACNQDVLNRLLLTSDPLITGMRSIMHYKKKALSGDALKLLLESDYVNVNILDDSNIDE